MDSRGESSSSKSIGDGERDREDSDGCGGSTIFGFVDIEGVRCAPSRGGCCMVCGMDGLRAGLLELPEPFVTGLGV